jgi:hypothetical protein
VCRCWAAGAERAHVFNECDVPSNGTRRRSCGGKLLREMQERDGRIKDAAQVVDEMPIRAVLENARVLLLGEASRMRAARTCADVTRQGRSERVSSSRKRSSSCTACRTTVCREVTRGVGGATVRRLRAYPHGSSRVARNGRWRPSRRR